MNYAMQFFLASAGFSGVVAFISFCTSFIGLMFYLTAAIAFGKESARVSIRATFFTLLFGSVAGIFCAALTVAAWLAGAEFI